MAAALESQAELAGAHRVSSWPALLFAALFTLAVNAALLALVAVLMRMHHATEPEPQIVTRFTATTVPPPPPPPQAQAPPAAAPEALLPALPPLAPAMPTPTALALPPPGPASLSLDLLPLSIPAFTVAEAPAATAVGPGAPALNIDHAAHIESPPAIARFYPFAARGHGITGESLVDLRIEADGRISSFSIVNSTPPGVFESALAGLVSNLQADPATAQGKPVASSLRLRIQWTLPK